MNKKRILIVDDDSLNRKLVSTILAKKGGYEVIEAENGLEALEIIAKKDVDLIFLDLIMPVMNGIEFLNKFNPKKNNIPVIVLTTDDSKKQEAKLAGATEVIIKPITPVNILEKTVEYLN